MGEDFYERIVREEYNSSQKFDILNTFEEPSIPEESIIENDSKLTDEDKVRLYLIENQKEELIEITLKKEDIITNKDDDKTRATSKKHNSNSKSIFYLF